MRTRSLVRVIGMSISVALLLCLPACKRKQKSGDARPYATTNESPLSTASVSPVPEATASAAPEATNSAAVLNQTGPVFVTSDGHYRVRAPGWKTDKSSDERNRLRIVKGGQALNMYEEKKIDFTATNIDEFMKHELTLKKKFNQLPRGPISTLTVAGRPARQVEIDVVMDDNRWRELLTIIEFPQEYLEVSVVVKPSQEDRAAMQAIVQTVEAAPL